MNGTTSSPGRIRGQLCTKLRFGNTVAADTMNPASPTSACCSLVQLARMRSAISGG